jgi:hypothetical protein
MSSLLIEEEQNDARTIRMSKPSKKTTPCETSTEFDNFKELTSKLLKVKQVNQENCDSDDAKTTPKMSAKIPLAEQVTVTELDKPLRPNLKFKRKKG